jgi:hypothetical protein
VSRPSAPLPSAPAPPPIWFVPLPDAGDHAGWVAEWLGRFPEAMVPGHAGNWSRRDEMLWHMDLHEALSACMEPHQAGPKIYRLILWFRPAPDGWMATAEIEHHLQDGNGLVEHTPTVEEVGWFEECVGGYLREASFQLDDPVDPEAAFFWGAYVQVL